ncbi:DUF3060 domain-containing protein [Arthrobacter agilis]|uniref:DUF3060 domain-containing protein n=1 Tax=Arthrobacter agilis TaxID=37921 RepID=UPI003593380C
MRGHRGRWKPEHRNWRQHPDARCRRRPQYRHHRFGPGGECRRRDNNTIEVGEASAIDVAGDETTIIYENGDPVIETEGNNSVSAA